MPAHTELPWTETQEGNNRTPLLRRRKQKKMYQGDLPRGMVRPRKRKQEGER